jgi:hypothetical protein
LKLLQAELGEPYFDAANIDATPVRAGRRR